ncbi:MAG: SDR family oxidoreductase [Alphaproteobacteria bacterium]
MKVLITGGGGFIGAWLARRLAGMGAAIRVFDLKDDRRLVRAVAGDAVADALDWHVGDVADAAAVRAAAQGCDRLIHLAALLTPACQADPVRGATVNLIGTLNLFEAARAHGIGTVLYMSSAAVFGPDDGTTPRPTTHYGAFKLACEGSARAYRADHGIASAGFRAFVVYGPGRDLGLTAGPSLACRAAAEGRDYTIPYSGPADYVFVGDLVEAFAATAARPPQGAAVYNVVGEQADAADVAAAIMRAAPGAAIRAEGPPLPVAADIAPGTLRDDYPEVPRTGLADGIARTIGFYRAA